MKNHILLLLSAGLTLGACNNASEEKVSEEAISNPLSAESDGQLNSKALPAIAFDKDLSLIHI